MSPRAIRRAAERQGLKLASNINVASAGNQTVNLHTQTPTPALAAADFDFSDDDGAPFASSTPLSDARRAANRENAQKSTGPTSLQGKAKSSMNAVKTGLTGRTVLLPTDDATVYQQHLDRHVSQYTPATDKEKSLVQVIADTEWRLLRIAPLEAGIYAIGRRELANEFPDEENIVNREALFLAKIFMIYRKDLGNLALQERRLRNQRAADIASLEQLQRDRRDKHRSAFVYAQKCYKMARQNQVSFDPAFFGFVFSIDELASRCLHEEAEKFVLGVDSELTQQQFDEYVAKWKQAKAA